MYTGIVVQALNGTCKISYMYYLALAITIDDGYFVMHKKNLKKITDFWTRNIHINTITFMSISELTQVMTLLKNGMTAIL